MNELDELKQSAERLAQTAKDSAEKLSEAARETSEIGVKVLREALRDLVKDPATVEKLRELESSFDRQIAQATSQIEDGAKQLKAFWGGLIDQAKSSGPEREGHRIDVEVERPE